MTRLIKYTPWAAFFLLSLLLPHLLPCVLLAHLSNKSLHSNSCLRICLEGTKTKTRISNLPYPGQFLTLLCPSIFHAHIRTSFFSGRTVLQTSPQLGRLQNQASSYILCPTDGQEPWVLFSGQSPNLAVSHRFHCPSPNPSSYHPTLPAITTPYFFLLPLLVLQPTCIWWPKWLFKV